MCGTRRDGSRSCRSHSHRAREPAKNGREIFRFNFSFGQHWHGNHYAIKQVAPVIKDEANEIVFITVYTFYF